MVTVGQSAGGWIDLQGGKIQNNNYKESWAANQGSLNVASGATLDMYASNVFVDGLTGSGTVTNGYAPGGVRTLTLGVAGTQNSASYGVSSNIATFNGTISGGSNLALTKTGGGTQTLSGGNINYTGITTINGGVLNLANATMSSATTVNTGAILRTTNTASKQYGTGFATTLNGGTMEHQQNVYNSYAGLLTVSAASTISTFDTGATTELYFDGGATGSADLAVNNTQATGGVVFRDNNSGYSLFGVVTVNGGHIGYGNNSSALNSAHLNLQGAQLNMVHNPSGVYLGSSTNETLGSLEGNSTSTIFSNTQLTVGSRNETTTFAGVYSGSGSLVKAGPGTQIFSGTNTYAGATTISDGTLVVTGGLSGTTALALNGGTLQLSVANNIKSAATLSMGGGTLNVSGTNQTLNTLNLTGGMSTIDFGAGNTGSHLTLGDSHAVTWAGGATLSIMDWNGSSAGGGPDELLFGNSTGLTPAQIAAITFVNPVGFTPGTYGAQLIGNELVAVVPEPGAWVSLLGGCGVLLGLRRRRRH
jgi:autotransporter-associated beta strand protein